MSAKGRARARRLCAALCSVGWLLVLGTSPALRSEPGTIGAARDGGATPRPFWVVRGLAPDAPQPGIDGPVALPSPSLLPPLGAPLGSSLPPASSAACFAPTGPAGESVHAAVAAEGSNLLPIDLPYALRRVGAANPTIALAQERVRQAYQAQRLASVGWVPNLWVGGNPHAVTFLPTFFHHDGLISNSRGQLFFTDRNQFFLPAGLNLDLSLTDAVFAPRAARGAAAAVAARARAVSHDVQLDVALAYLDLLRAYGALAINAEALRHVGDLVTASESAERVGLGQPADANQARAEREARQRERYDFQGQAALASARLAQLLLLEPTVDLLPADQAVLPIALVPEGCSLDELVALGLMNRPELAESRALIGVALARWRQERWRPLLPTLQVVYYGGSYIGGNPQPRTAGGREDVIAQATWELQNGGLGNLFRAREARSVYNQANLRQSEVQARVAAEVTGAAKLVLMRVRGLQRAQLGVEDAQEMWRRLKAASFGVSGPSKKYDPIQPLLAERALHDARLGYLRDAIEYNREQFRLYWAMGQPPVCSLDKAVAQPVAVPVMPGPPRLPPERKGKGKLSPG